MIKIEQCDALPTKVFFNFDSYRLWMSVLKGKMHIALRLLIINISLLFISRLSISNLIS